MSTVSEDLKSFHKFAEARIADDVSADSLDDLFTEWQDSRSRDEINAAIRKGLDDVKAGRVQPAEKVMEEIRQQFGFSKE
jgi:predicted transcriptional regulator